MNADTTPNPAAADAIDLDFEAFRYISGEMPTVEVARFEDLLGANQSAREAVARAVELTQAIAAAAPCPRTIEPSRADRRQWHRVAACLVTIAACIAVAVALRPVGQSRIPSEDNDPIVASIDRDRAEELLALWSRAEIADEDADGESGAFVLWVDESDGHDAETNGENEFGWMLAAVCIEPVPQDADSPGPPEQEEL